MRRRKHGVDHLASCRLAEAARDADDQPFLLRAIPASKIRERSQRVLDHDHRRNGTVPRSGLPGFLSLSESIAPHDGQTGSSMTRFDQKGMSVVMLATQRPENVTGPDAARVDVNPRERCLSVRDADNLPVSRGCQ